MLTGLQAAGTAFAWAYGNADTDILAYQDVAIPDEHIFLVGDLAGEMGVTPIPTEEACTAHLEAFMPGWGVGRMWKGGEGEGGVAAGARVRSGPSRGSRAKGGWSRKCEIPPPSPPRRGHRYRVRVTVDPSGLPEDTEGSSMKRISLPWTTLIAYATGANKRFVPATGWLNAAGFTRVRAAFELVSAQTNFSATFAYQTANVEDNPDTAVEVGSAQTADGMNYGTLTDISNNTNGKQLVRFGWMCQNTNAAALIAAMSAGVVDFDAC